MSSSSTFASEIYPVRDFVAEHVPEPVNAMPGNLNDFLSVEMGAGVGMHALQFAAQNPDFTHIAIERTQNKFQKMQRQADFVKLDNLFVVRDDAVNFMLHRCSPGSIDEVHILYPNPYPKNSSARWVRMPFFRHLLSLVKPNGKIIFSTNIKEYSDEVKLYCLDYWELSLIKEDKLHKNTLDSDYQIKTHFEKKYLEDGQTCYHQVFQISK